MATVWAREGGRRSTPGHERAEGTRGGNADDRHAQELHESALAARAPDDETTDEKTAARCEPPAVNRRRARAAGWRTPRRAARGAAVVDERAVPLTRVDRAPSALATCREPTGATARAGVGERG